MKSRHAVGILSSLLLLQSSLPVQAEPAPDKSPVYPVVARLDVVSLSDQAAQKWNSAERVQGGLAAHSELKLIQSCDLLTTTGRPALFHLGRKHPLVYFDARSSQFQIQYVDTGMKLDVVARTRSDGQLQAEVHSELSNVEVSRGFGTPPTAHYPQTEVLMVNCELPKVQWGESFIVSRVDGPNAYRYLSALNLEEKGEHVMMILTLLRP